MILVCDTLTLQGYLQSQKTIVDIIEHKFLRFSPILNTAIYEVKLGLWINQFDYINKAEP